VTTWSSLFFFALLSVAACSADFKHDAGGYLLPICSSPADSSASTRLWSVGADAFGTAPGKSLCTASTEHGLALGRQLRIIPYRSGLADLEFVCDQDEARRFMRQNAGERVAIVLGGKVAGEVAIVPQPTDFRCGLLALDSLETAIRLCERMSRYLGSDGATCTEVCENSNRDQVACVRAGARQ
jgi:hypothetical protein